MGSTEDALRAAYSVANSRDEWATGIVTAGVVIELVALLLFGKEMPRNEKIALAVGSILVVLGVGGEWVFGSRASAIAAQIQQASEEKIAELAKDEGADHKIAAQAAAYAANLGVTVEKLPVFAAKTEKEISGQIADFQKFAAAEQARDKATITALTSARNDVTKARTDTIAAANVAIQASAAMAATNAPRDFTVAQQADVKKRLAQFAPARVDIITFGDTKEIADFGRKLSETLQLAGWKPKLWAEFNGASYGVTGIPIFAKGGSSPVVARAANALESAIQDARISAKVLPMAQAGPNWENPPGAGINGPPWDAKDIADLRVFVGAK